MQSQHQPSYRSEDLTSAPALHPSDRPFLLLEDLVTDPIEFQLSDFGGLDDELRSLH